MRTVQQGPLRQRRLVYKLGTGAPTRGASVPSFSHREASLAPQNTEPHREEAKCGSTLLGMADVADYANAYGYTATATATERLYHAEEHQLWGH
jgi:hypothetical protein